MAVICFGTVVLYSASVIYLYFFLDHRLRRRDCALLAS